MTLHIRDAELLVTAPGSSAAVADFRVPASAIESVNARSRAGRDIAQGTVVIDASDGAYTTGQQRIDFDDECQFRVAWPGDTGGTAFGTGDFGNQAFGPQWTVSETLIVTSWQVTGPRHNATLNLTVENFVFNRLRERIVDEYRALDKPISGSADAHLDTVLREYVPDVDGDRLPTIDETIDYSVDKKEARKVVAELARLAHNATGRSWLVGATGTSLTVTALDNLQPQWTAGDGQTDLGQLQHSSDAGDLINEIRVEGGVDPDNIDDSQETQTAFETVTSSTRKDVRVDSRKSELPRIEVYARKRSNSDDDLRVRLQADDGNGNPIAPADTDSDIVNGRESVPDGFEGWLTIQLGEHTIAPRERPHLLIDSPGSDGQDVGVDGSDVPAYRVYFSKPVIVRIPDTPSQGRYRVHDATVNDDNLRTFNAARNRGRADLDRAALPKLTLTAPALSRRAHAVTVGDVITLDYPWLRATGDYVVTGVAHAYRGSELDTELTLRSVARFA